MKISLDWLASWLPLDAAPTRSPEDLCDILTASGLEVEGLEEMEERKGGGLSVQYIFFFRRRVEERGS